MSRWELPEAWEWATAGEIAEIVGGGTPSTSDATNFEEAGFPWLTPADLSGYDGECIERGARSLSAKGLASSSARLMPAGTVLFTSRAPIGYCVIAANEVATNQGFKSLVLKGSINRHFVRHYLLASKDYAESLSSGSTFKELSGSRMAELEVPIPPLPEQRRIVARIEELQARTRRAREALETVPALLERFRQSVLASAFRGDLTADWRESHPDVEPASVLLERIRVERRLRWEVAELAKLRAKGKEPTDDRWKRRYKEPEPVDLVGLPALPEGWAWATVEQLSTKVTDGVHKKPTYVQAGVPFVTVKNLTAGPGISLDDVKYVTREDHAKFAERADPERGDVLVSKDGTLGVIRLIETDTVFSIFVSVALIKPATEKLGPYLAAALSAPQGQAGMKATGSGLQHIHLVDLRATLVPVPPAAEMTELLTRIHLRMDQAVITTQVGAASRLLDDLDRAILARAFRGELVPQDPNDEPASVLLERIRAERDQQPRRGRRRNAATRSTG